MDFWEWLQGVLKNGKDTPQTLPINYAQPRVAPPAPQRVMARTGILPQMTAEDRAFAQRVYQAVYPAAYTPDQWGPKDEERLARGEAAQGQSRAMRVGRAFLNLPNDPRIQASPAREDAWKLYLGIPQSANTFSVSEFRPSTSKEQNTVYLSMPQFLDRVQQYGIRGASEEGGAWLVKEQPTQASTVRELVGLVKKGQGRAILSDDAVGVMGHFTLGLGRDEHGEYISYYDEWDLDPFSEGSPANRVADRVGRPFEIYDRIYFNPSTYEPYRPRK